MTTHDFSLHVSVVRGVPVVHCRGRGATGGAGWEGTHAPDPEAWAALHDLPGLLGREQRASWGEAATAGARLFTTVLGGEVGQCYRVALEAAQEHRAWLRVLIEYDTASGSGGESLHELPWELLFNTHRGRFLALDDGLLLARHLRGRGRDWRQPGGPFRMLLTSANPADRPPLALDAEVRRVRAWVEPCGVAPVVRGRLGGRRLAQEFGFAAEQDRRFHVWHHCGHGGETGDGRFALALHARDGDPTSPSVLIEPGELIEVVAAHEDLQLVILNVCLGAGRGGLGTLLASLDVPAVIGFRSRVTDATALGVAEALWRRLVHRPVDEAVRGARRSLAGMADPLEFARLLLFLRTRGRPGLDSALAATATGPE